MRTAIIYYSEHHGNTKKLLDAIAAADPEVVLIDAAVYGAADLYGFDRVGLASGIYYGNFAKQVIQFAWDNLPEGMPVFFIYTYGALMGNFLRGIREVTRVKNCWELGEYRCRGFDTFGPFKRIGGIAKGHPTQEEIEGAARFYRWIS